MAIAEDEDGWLWFGGIDGLYRYDGSQRVKWGGDFIGEPIEILSVERGCAVVLGQDRHLYTLTREAWEEIPAPVADHNVVHAAQSDGGLWAVADGALFRRDGAGWRRVDAPFAVRLVRTAAVGVWALGESEIARIDADGVVRERHPIPNAMDVAVDATGGWVATREKGVWRWDGGGARRIADYGEEWGESVALAPGGAWVATTARVLRFVGDRIAHEIPVSRGIPQHDVLHVDREGSLWVGTWAGPRVRTTPDAWRLEAPGTDPWVTWLSRRADTTWVASWNVAGRFVGEAWQPTAWTGFSWPFCDTPEGDVTLAWRPGHSAIVRLGDPIVELAPLPPETTFGGCAVAPDGGLWVGLSTGLHHFADGVLRPVETPAGDLAALAVDRSGRLHLVGAERECHADAAEVLGGSPAWTCAKPWAGWVPRQIAEVADGRMWAVGLSTGLLEETADGWVRHPGTATLPSPTIRSLVPSRRGGVWLAAVGPLLRVAPGAPGEPWTVLERLDGTAGVPAGGAVHVSEGDDGGLWLATDEGVIAIPPGHRELAPPPSPELTDVRLNGIETTADVPLVATWPHNQLELRAASATWRDRSRMRWRARVGNAPLTDSPDPTLRIVDLPAGQYAITVEASADGGVTWSPPSAALHVEVPLPWYLRWPALVAAGVVLVAAIAVAWRIRLEAALRVERERTRIAMDLHDDLGAGLSTISMLTGLAAGNDLTDDARREVAGVVATIAATLADSLAGIVWTLRNDAGSPATLAQSLVERARRLFPTTRLVIDVAAEWPQRQLPLALYRSLQLIGYEALGNVAKHAEATEVTLRFHPWTLEIADDGRGLDALSPRAGTGTGLASMKARAASVRAVLEVGDRPGGGTVVKVTFRP
jgi:signal transduction histidine kinase/ligand-binding sensor domain-containing protein